MTDPNLLLGKMLKAYRKEYGWSLDKTSEKTGVSKAMLGQIERGESSPTVATLWKIATGFGQSLTSFIEPDAGVSSGTIVRNPEDNRQHPAQGGLLVSPIFAYEDRFGFETLEITFRPGFERISDPHENGMTEQLTVLKGELEIWSEALWHKVPKGSTIRFAADEEHGYRNREEEDAIVLAVNHYRRRPR